MMSLFRSGAVLILSILLLEVSRTLANVRVRLPKHFFDEIRDHLTWSVDSTLPEMTAGIANAFGFWANHSRFSFYEIPSGESPANIRIINLRNFEEPYSLFTEDNITKTTVAYTMYDPKKLSGVVFVTGYEIWKGFSTRNKKALNIESVVKHQLGYILGQKDTAAFNSTMTPSYKITNISNLTKEEKASTFFGIEIDDVKTLIKESYKMPQDICIPNFNRLQFRTFKGFGYFIGKYFYNNENDKVALVRDYWPLLPENLTQIDGYFLDYRGFEIFFIGQQAYAITNREPFLTLPAYVVNNWLKEEGVDHVDFVFRHDYGMYIVKGKTCWKFFQTREDDYIITNERVKFSTEYGRKAAIIETHIFDHAWVSVDHVAFNWLGFACQPGQKELVPPECCNL